jgi:hypothetical protein
VARVGYATKGVLNLLVGALAIAAGTGHGGRVGGPDVAARAVGEQPFGAVMLGMIAIGMFGLAMFRFVEAIFDPEGFSDEGRAKGAIKRAGCVLAGTLNAGLGVLAAQLAWGDRPDRGAAREWLSSALSWHPIGPLLVGIAGAGVVVFALYQLSRSWTTNFTKRLRTGEMSATIRRVAIAVGRAGFAAHGVVLGVIGVGLVEAAIESSPRQPIDIGSALRDIASSTHGQVLLVTVAAGLFLYGLYGLVEARYRDLSVPA